MCIQAFPSAPALRVLAAALLLAFGRAGAAESSEIHALITPETTVRLGVASVDGGNARFGQYSGLSESRVYGLADFSLVQRDDATATWLRASGRNLGLASREAAFGYERQGDWGVALAYSRIPRLEPLVFTTRLSGIGSASQAQQGQAAREVRLSTTREQLSFGFDKTLARHLDFQLRLRNEEKNGSRLFGRGSGEFLAEPIDSRTQQFEATLGYAGADLQLLGGYHASTYLNRHQVLDMAAGTDISLAPDNQSHQVYLAGGYRFTPATRMTFKLAYGRGTQNETFYAAPDFPGNTQTSLNARVDTATAQLGLTSRPLPGLNLLANVRHEDRQDKTPRVQFLSASTGRDGFNTPFSRTTTASRLEASYQLPAGLRVTAGAELEQRDRTVLAIRQASWREKNDETTYRVELRRSLGESLNGSVALLRGRRQGSDYLPANNNAAADLIDPIHFADRERDRVRLSLDWVPTEALSLQLLVDESKDRYDGRARGPESGRSHVWSLDGSYTLSDDWQLTAWASNDETRMQQSTLSGANGTAVPAQTWTAQLLSRGEAAGLGLRGKPTAGIEIGADLQLARDKNAYNLAATLPTAALLPSINHTRSTLRLFGQYALKPNLALRVDLGLDRSTSDDWTWTGWTYADGTTVRQEPHGKTVYLGVAIEYRQW
jgi:MtrB/PioB family decaheme-associated outer membrane protein